MALGGVMLQLLAGAHGIPGWLAGIDSWRLAMMLIALPGPVFFLLVLTMPLGPHGGGAGSPAAADGAAPRDFIPSATAARPPTAGLLALQGGGEGRRV